MPAEVAALAPFAAAGVLDASEVQLAALLARRAPGADDPTLLGAALAARAPRLGHVCVELATVAGTVAVDGLGADALADLPWPEPAAWAAALAASPLVHVGATAPADAAGEVRPLVWDGARLTLHRYARYERGVAAALLARAGAVAATLVPAEDLDALLDRFFGEEPAGAPDLQRRAAATALTRPLAVVAGGPGTGKTRTVARTLAVAQTAAAARGRALHVALVAPTGKAAARLTEAVHHEIDQVELDPGVADRMRAAEALTVHRLLGRADGIRFRHDADDPVAHDLVVVDESSMASLPLVARLLDAVRPDAHVVLVGDPDQLASVEAGAVLGEIVRAAAGSTAGAPLPDAVVRLDRVHRFGAESAIAALADAIRGGDADTALALLHDPERPDVALVDPTDGDALSALEDELAEAATRLAAAAAAGDAAAAMAAALDVKVLAATRRGPNGV
ncbi:MAG TPA: AAA family ATPase, partial [Aquihabitans sp.]|nr:AAA family ATPase [Aquihabitans sp.]